MLERRYDWGCDTTGPSSVLVDDSVQKGRRYRACDTTRPSSFLVDDGVQDVEVDVASPRRLDLRIILSKDPKLERLALESDNTFADYDPDCSKHSCGKLPSPHPERRETHGECSASRPKWLDLIVLLSKDPALERLAQDYNYVRRSTRHRLGNSAKYLLPNSKILDSGRTKKLISSINGKRSQTKKGKKTRRVKRSFDQLQSPSGRKLIRKLIACKRRNLTFTDITKNDFMLMISLIPAPPPRAVGSRKSARLMVGKPSNGISSTPLKVPIEKKLPSVVLTKDPFVDYLALQPELSPICLKSFFSMTSKKELLPKIVSNPAGVVERNVGLVLPSTNGGNLQKRTSQNANDPPVCADSDSGTDLSETPFILKIGGDKDDHSSTSDNLRVGNDNIDAPNQPKPALASTSGSGVGSGMTRHTKFPEAAGSESIIESGQFPSSFDSTNQLHRRRRPIVVDHAHPARPPKLVDTAVKNSERRETVRVILKRDSQLDQMAFANSDLKFPDFNYPKENENPQSEAAAMKESFSCRVQSYCSTTCRTRSKRVSTMACRTDVNRNTRLSFRRIIPEDEDPSNISVSYNLTVKKPLNPNSLFYTAVNCNDPITQLPQEQST